jgi:hypothetical protein
MGWLGRGRQVGALPERALEPRVEEFLKPREWGMAFWLFALRYLLWLPAAWRASVRMRIVADGYPSAHAPGDRAAACTNGVHYAMAGMTVALDYLWTTMTIMVFVVAVGVPVHEGWLAIPLSILLLFPMLAILLVRLQTV